MSAVVSPPASPGVRPRPQWFFGVAASIEDFARVCDTHDLAALVAAGDVMEERATHSLLDDDQRRAHWGYAVRTLTRAAYVALLYAESGVAVDVDVAALQRRVLFASEVWLSLLTDAVGEQRLLAGNRAAAMAARTLGANACDVARDVQCIGLVPSDADRIALAAFLAGANAYRRSAAFGEPNPLECALQLVHASAAFDDAAHIATRAGLVDQAQAAGVASYGAAQDAAAAFVALAADATELRDRITLLGRAIASAQHCATLIERDGAWDDAHVVRDWMTGLDERRAALIETARATGTMTERELVEAWVIDAARIMNGVRHRGMKNGAVGAGVNCQRVIVTGLAWTSGTAIAAPAWTPGSSQDGDLLGLYERAYGGTFARVDRAQVIVDQLTAAGPGAKGIVHIARPSRSNHLVVAENSAGTVYFLEYQSGAVRTLSTTGDDISSEVGQDVWYTFLQTHDPARPRRHSWERRIAIDLLERIDALTALPDASEPGARRTTEAIGDGATLDVGLRRSGWART